MLSRNLMCGLIKNFLADGLHFIVSRCPIHYLVNQSTYQPFLAWSLHLLLRSDLGSRTFTIETTLPMLSCILPCLSNFSPWCVDRTQVNRTALISLLTSRLPSFGKPSSRLLFSSSKKPLKLGKTTMVASPVSPVFLVSNALLATTRPIHLLLTTLSVRFLHTNICKAYPSSTLLHKRKPFSWYSMSILVVRFLL